jgi:DUF4097 and DUF4098 domain-containing protein YvlB
MADNEGRIKILEMLQEGKIDAAQAVELLKQFPEEDRKKVDGFTIPKVFSFNTNDREDFEDGMRDFEDGIEDGMRDFHNNFRENSQQRREERQGRKRKHHNPPPPISSEFMDWVREIKNDISDGLNFDIDIDLDGLFGNKRAKTDTVVFKTETFGDTDKASLIKLIGKNSNVTLKGYDGDAIKFTCTYNARRTLDKPVQLIQENGHFEIIYDYDAMRSFHISCEVPRKLMIENIFAETKNSTIDVYGIYAGGINLSTKNSPIKIQDVSCNELLGRTRNANVKIERVACKDLVIETSNSKIDAEYVVAHIAQLKTSNAKITTEDCDIVHLIAKTTNASLRLDNEVLSTRRKVHMPHAVEPKAEYDPQYANSEGYAPSDESETYHAGAAGERTITAQTSNGSIALYLPSRTGLKIQASTSNSRINCELPNMNFTEMAKTYVNGQSNDYENFEERLNANLSTTNGSVKIKSI